MVLTLRNDALAQREVRLALASRPQIEIGEAIGVRLPIVAETRSRCEHQELFEWIRSLPGVADVSLAFAEIADEPAHAREAQPHDVQ